jgi:DNA-binding transcriptional regulator YhcF (GntR family)
MHAVNSGYVGPIGGPLRRCQRCGCRAGSGGDSFAKSRQRASATAQARGIRSLLRVIFPGQQGPLGFREVAALLREQITSGQLRPGQRLPTEIGLAQTYGVGTKTARSALHLLRSEGLAEAVRGYGWVVRERPEAEVVAVGEGWSARARPATAAERAEHGIPEGVWVLHVVDDHGLGELRWPADEFEVRVQRTPGPAGGAEGRAR